MKYLILLLSLNVFAQSELETYVNDFKECHSLGNNIEIIKEIAFKELDKPYEIYLYEGTKREFTILIDPRVKNKRKAVYEAIEVCIVDNLIPSNVE